MADYGDQFMSNGDYDDEMGGNEYDQDISPEDCWKVIGSFFERKGLVSMQIDSFDKFMSQTIKDLVMDKGSVTLDYGKHPEPDEINPVVIERHEVKFLDVTLSYPNVVEGDGVTNDLMPHEARLRSLTYACPAFILMSKKTYYAREAPSDSFENLEGMVTQGTDGMQLYWEVGHSNDDIPEDRPESVYIGKIPVMLKSGSCWLNQDPSKTKTARKIYRGYFIINGSEKVLIAQERSAGNIVQIFTKASPSPFTHLAECRSVVEGGSRQMSQCTVKLYRKSDGPDGTKIENTLKVQLPYVKMEIPLAIVFRALDIVSDSDIIEKICFDHSDKEMIDMLMGSLQEGQAIQRGELARSFIATRTSDNKMTASQRQTMANDILQKEWLPHIGKGADSLTQKAYYLGYMVNRLLKCALGRTEPDDRDHLGKKRLDLAGPLMTNLFRSLFDRATKDFFRYMQKRNWGDQKKLDKAKAGVSQVLNRYAYASTVSHLRRTNAPIGREGKIAKPRQLHNTHWGYVCPAETPEGQACGLVKNLALMSLVTNDVPVGPLRQYILEKDVETIEDWEPKLNSQATKVFLNGVWFGVIVQHPRRLVDHIRELRRKCIVDSTIGLVWDIREKEFRITGEGGRIIRPLFVVENDTTNARNGGPPPEEPCNWDILLSEGTVEYLDAEEEETAMIVMTPEHLNDSKIRDGGGIIETGDDPLARHDPLLTGANTMFTHCEIHPA
ncbi:DNA-directed RNA polymerase II subunit RPB2 [Cyphellophora attinorum]|uniref:DNA-directed RNA polymerase n=1 Tax=Cyphellophora attinorum TaxID=1664694 RepID=A0A0N1NVV2_9EURO|nr:DNA-directed RNA polymerase II subunit RPB2 [Phialophora attinorum]KPI35423.1 DNA-directed RNA polymerase II subunit RPB2 [Phialophora attinorum]